MRTRTFIAAAAALLTAAGATAASADVLPYFRFYLGQDGGGDPGPQPGTNDAKDLAFGQADALPSGAVGTPVSADYAASGGTPPYAMTLLSAPPGVALTQTSDGRYHASGTLSPAGSFQAAVVHLTDSAGHSADFPVPVTVTDPAQPQALAFDAQDPLPSGIVGTPVRSYFSAVGGKAPYRMSLVKVPSGVTFSQVGTIAWAATGDLGQAGDFPAAVVNLVDSAGTSVTLPVPLTVTQPDPLAFAQTNDFPATFPTYTQQSATFSVGGGSPPYTWSMASAPTTVIASGSSGGAGSVVGSVETPGTYTGVTLTVTDVTGTSVSRTLAPFTVTDSGQPHLDVSGLAPLPATMNVGDAFSSQMQVSGASNSPNGAVGAAFTGLPGGDSAYAFQMTSGADPVGMSAILIVNSPGPRDVYIQLTDYNDGTRQKLVHWGTTNVVAAPLQAVSQFPSQVTGTGGTTQTVYARFKGYYNNATPAVSQPASLNASPSIQGCNNYTPCDPASGGQNGESIVALSVTFPPPGTYSGVRVSVSTDRGEKIFFDPFDVVSTPPQPLRIVKQFDTPIKLQSSPYGGVYMDEVYGVFSGGSPATSASVSTNSMDLSNLYVTVKNCTDWSYLCNQLGVDPSNALVSMSGYLYNAGHYPGIVVSLSDPALTQGASFDPVTIDIAPPPLSNCAFKPLSAMSASDNTVPSAVTFTGGVAPYSVTASSDAVSFGPDTGSGIGHAFDGKVASNAAATSVHVSVADAAGGTCSGDVDLSNYQFVSGPGLDVAVVNQATNPYGNVTSYLVTQSATNDITAQMNDPANGPLGAHPDWNGVVLQFVTPGGQSVQGYSLASSQSPITHALYGPGPVQESYGAGYPPTPGYLYTQNLQNLEDYQLPASDYTYRYYVFLSDGTYRLSSPFTTHVLTWTYPGQ